MSALIRGACHQIQSGALTAPSQPHRGPTLGPTQMPAVTCTLKMAPAMDRINSTAPKAKEPRRGGMSAGQQGTSSPAGHHTESYRYD